MMVSKLENLKIGIDVVEEKDILEFFEEFEISIKDFYLQKYDFSLSEVGISSKLFN